MYTYGRMYSLKQRSYFRIQPVDTANVKNYVLAGKSSQYVTGKNKNRRVIAAKNRRVTQ